jgi:hypothetical protein
MGRTPVGVGVVVVLGGCFFHLPDEITPADAGTDTAAEGSAESGVDAGSDAEWCKGLSPTPAFCDDFDHPGSVGASWSSVEGNVLLDSLVPFTPPNDARFFVQASSPNCAYARLHKSFGGALSHVRFGFSARLGDLDGGAFPEKIGVAAVEFVGLCREIIELGPPTDHSSLHEQLADGSGDILHDMTATRPSIGTWARIDIVLDMNQLTADMYLDNQKALDTITLRSECRGQRPVDIEVGLRCVATLGSSVELRLDDVTFDGN